MSRLAGYLKYNPNDIEDAVIIYPDKTLSEIVRDGLEAIDNAVRAVIARHEKEIAMAEAAKMQEAKLRAMKRDSILRYNDEGMRHAALAARGDLRWLQPGYYGGLGALQAQGCQAQTAGFSAQQRAASTGIFGF